MHAGGCGLVEPPMELGYTFGVKFSTIVFQPNFRQDDSIYWILLLVFSVPWFKGSVLTSVFILWSTRLMSSLLKCS